MHPNPTFRQKPRELNIAFAQNRSFGVLAVNHSSGPLISHIPFLLSDDGLSIEAHLVRSNPIVPLLISPVAATIAVNSGDAYISPDWYGVDDQVPTWNYVAVHIKGTIRRLEDEALHGVLNRLSEKMENRLLPKPVWTTDKMQPEIFKRMQRQIVPIAMEVEQIDGTWKLSQNKPEEAKKGAIDGLKRQGFGNDVSSLIKLMETDVE